MKEDDVIDRINKRHNGNKDILDALMVILATLHYSFEMCHELNVLSSLEDRKSSKTC